MRAYSVPGTEQNEQNRLNCLHGVYVLEEEDGWLTYKNKSVSCQMEKTKAGRREGIAGMSGGPQGGHVSGAADGALQTSRDLVFIWVRWESPGGIWG